MLSPTRILGAAGAGALLGAVVFGIFTPLIYNFFFPGGVHRLMVTAEGDQMLPIVLVFVAIGGMIGAAAGAAWALPDSPLRSG